MTPASYREWVDDGDDRVYRSPTGLEAWSARAERHIAALEDRALKAEARLRDLREAMDDILVRARAALEVDDA